MNLTKFVDNKELTDFVKSKTFKRYCKKTAIVILGGLVLLSAGFYYITYSGPYDSTPVGEINFRNGKAIIEKEKVYLGRSQYRIDFYDKYGQSIFSFRIEDIDLIETKNGKKLVSCGKILNLEEIIPDSTVVGDNNIINN